MLRLAALLWRATSGSGGQGCVSHKLRQRRAELPARWIWFQSERLRSTGRRRESLLVPAQGLPSQRAAGPGARAPASGSASARRPRGPRRALSPRGSCAGSGTNDAGASPARRTGGPAVSAQPRRPRARRSPGGGEARGRGRDARGGQRPEVWCAPRCCELALRRTQKCVRLSMQNHPVILRRTFSKGRYAPGRADYAHDPADDDRVGTATALAAHARRVTTASRRSPVTAQFRKVTMWGNRRTEVVEVLYRSLQAWIKVENALLLFFRTKKLKKKKVYFATDRDYGVKLAKHFFFVLLKWYYTIDIILNFEFYASQCILDLFPCL